jgi:hypothetical protein
MSNLAIDEFAIVPRCEQCGSILKGRFGKRFCKDACRKGYARDLKKIREHAGPLLKAIERNQAAKSVLYLGGISPIQAEIVRHAHVINEILKRKADTNPLINFSVWENFEIGIKNCVHGWQCDFGDHVDRISDPSQWEESILEIVSDLIGEDFD